MQQVELWHDTVFDALAAAVQAAGGVKKVAAALWPSVDGTSAGARLRGALNPEHAQKLCPEELLMVMRLGRDGGDHSVMNFLARTLGYEIEPLSPEDTKKRAVKARKKALLDELRRLEDEGTS